MSASDSDNSIDWLASDDEDNESELESDFTKRPTQTQPPPSSSHLGQSEGSNSSSELKEEEEEEDEERSWGGSREDSSSGTPASCIDTLGSHASGLCHTGRSERTKVRKTQQAKKRPHSPVVTEAGSKDRPLTSNQSEKDWLFSNKCRELQCYIQPLSSILKGLRTGRYKERLSSFQESVAMDRIQRIMGVLQKPCMGGQYMNIILKMEDMLKSWFPNVKPRDQHTVSQTEEAAPIKRAKQSFSTTALPTAAASPVTFSDLHMGAKAMRVTDLTPPGAYSASNLKWLHTSPICSPKADQGPPGTRQPPFPRALTQDSAVSSSTDIHAQTNSAPSRPPLAKINAPCLERLLKSTESIISRKGAEDTTGSSWS